jgi:hypothetical protein
LSPCTRGTPLCFATHRRHMAAFRPSQLRVPRVKFSNLAFNNMDRSGGRRSRNRYRCPPLLSVSDMPACLGHSKAETTIRLATEKLSDKQITWQVALRLLARASASANAGHGTRAIRTWCATPNSHRRVQKLPALIGNPRSSQQIMGQLPIRCCLKAKKFNDFSRARACVCQENARCAPLFRTSPSCRSLRDRARGSFSLPSSRPKKKWRDRGTGCPRVRRDAQELQN